MSVALGAHNLDAVSVLVCLAANSARDAVEEGLRPLHVQALNIKQYTGQPQPLSNLCELVTATVSAATTDTCAQRGVSQPAQQ